MMGRETGTGRGLQRRAARNGKSPLPWRAVSGFLDAATERWEQNEDGLPAQRSVCCLPHVSLLRADFSPRQRCFAVGC